MADINPYESPACCDYLVPTIVVEDDQSQQGLFRKGNQLVMHKQASLPDRCVKSNQPAGGLRLRRSLSWHHPMLYLTLFIGVLIFVILAVILRKQATIEIGLSEEWFRKRRSAILVGWILALSGIAIAALSLLAISDPHGQMAWAGWGIPIGILTLLGGMIFGLLNSQMVTPARITDNFIWLKGVHPDFLADLPAWPNDP